MSIQHLVNQYQPRTETINLNDNVRVAYVEASYQKTIEKVKKLLVLLKGALNITPLADKTASKVPFDFNFDFSAIAVNLASPEMKDIESFIRENCFISIKHDEEWLNVEMSKDAQVEYVFNTYPDVVIKFIFEGVKFHFLKYSANILDSVMSQVKKEADQEANKALLKSLTTG